jgi:hypothetical protein
MLQAANDVAGLLDLTLVLPQMRPTHPLRVLLMRKINGKHMALEEASLSDFTAVVENRVYERSYDGLDPGDYRIRIEPFALEFDTVITATQEQQVLVEIPEVTHFDIECTGPDSQWLCLAWAYASEPDRLNFVFQDQPAQRAFDVWARPEPIVLRAVGSQASSEWMTIEPSPIGPSQVIATLGPDNFVELQLELRDAGGRRQMNRNEWDQVEVTPEGHGGQLLTRLWGLGRDSIRYGNWGYPDYSRAQFIFSEPGRYRFSFFEQSEELNERQLVLEQVIDVSTGTSRWIVSLP